MTLVQFTLLMTSVPLQSAFARTPHLLLHPGLQGRQAPIIDRLQGPRAEDTANAFLARRRAAHHRPGTGGLSGPVKHFRAPDSESHIGEENLSFVELHKHLFDGVNL